MTSRKIHTNVDIYYRSNERTFAGAASDGTVLSPPGGVALATAVDARAVVVTLGVTAQARVARVARADARVVELGAVQADVVTIATHPTLEHNQNW